ncbi:hypothetical protein JKF63_00095 [Porcisia hertigi]|uniref:Uncharacterized protein n=1 Tax=Porcisia hertigi TaxID=2761500 RepID=A0A836HAZ9_9TRYP|nr:hypothetical protein JKF63_00095 [Porcisia hertigi]
MWKGKGASRQRRSCLGAVLSLFLLLLSADAVQGAEAEVQLQLEKLPWTWLPQLDLPIPPDFVSGQRIGSTAEQWMVLSHVGVPLLIDAVNINDLTQIMEVVNFMRTTAAGGVCPRYTTTYSSAHYWFHPEELVLLYGEERWFALQRLQSPAAWSLVLKEDIGPAVRAAERFIADLQAVDPPGQITIIFHGQESAVAPLRVSLADFKVVLQSTRLRGFMEHRIPQLLVDAEAPPYRLHIQRLLRSKLQYHEGIRTFDEAVAEAQHDVLVSLDKLRESEQAAYAQHRRFKQSYQRFLRERQARSQARRDTSRAAKNTDKDTSAGSHRVTGLRIRHPPGTSFAPLAGGGGDVACRKVSAAWNTLRVTGVRDEGERRAVQLRRLHLQHRCTEPLPNLLRTPSAVQENTRLSPAAADVWRDGVVEMKMQRRKSGRSPTFAQVFALVYHVWRAEAAQRMPCSPDNATSVAVECWSSSTADSAFDAAEFVAFVEQFVQNGNAVAAAPNHRLPSWINAELHYTLALLQLVGPHAMPPKRHLAQASSIARAVVSLHVSVSAGSHHAAGALATLREHGIYVRQHSKAAMTLLLRSMEHAPTNLWRELLVRRGSHGSPSSTKGAIPQPDASRLLRFEQFYAVDHSFSEVDDPFMTRQSVATLVATTNENVQIGEEEPGLEDVYREAEVRRVEGNDEGPLTARLKRRLLKANMLLSGFKGVHRDAREAQCELLVILRHLGYLCDLDLRSLFASGHMRHRRDSFSAGSMPWVTLIGAALTESCAEHETELLGLVKNGHRTLLSCPNNAALPPRRSERRLDVPNSETLFELLRETLLSLSYVNLIYTHRYDLSHLYASLSLALSLHVSRTTTVRCTTAASMGTFSDAAPYSSSRHKAAADSLVEAVKRVAESDQKIAWCAEMLLARLEKLRDSAAKARVDDVVLKGSLQRALQRFANVADSPLLSTESLILLGVSRWAARGPLSSTAVEVAAFERDVSEWAMAPFDLFQRLMSNSSRGPTAAATQQAPQPPPSEGTSKSSSDLGVRTPLMDVHALFLVCLAAMKRWKDDFPLLHTLDATSYSVRRTDPFVLGSFLLRARDAATGAPLISIEKLRNIAFAASPHFMGETPHLLPRVDDTVDSYAARLLRFAARHIYALEPSVALLRTGGYGAHTTVGKSSAAAETMVKILWARSLDDGPPRQSRLRILRRAKQRTMENADLQTLLYAADVHDYMNHSRWTSGEALLNAVYNTLISPFTTSTAEALILEMEAQLQLLTPQEREAAVGKRGQTGFERLSFQRESKGTAVTAFLDAFAVDATLREFFIAGHLLSLALEAGMPEGFSLILLEVTGRGNPHLHGFAEHLAEFVFGPLAPSVWTGHHLTAQWQREKKKTVEEGSLFVLDTRSPFRYASVEARQELFARVSRWNAAKAQRVDDGEACLLGKRQRSRISRALDELLWCTGLLTRQVYKDTHRVYPYAYEGSVFPAADLECVAEMNHLLEAQGSHREAGLPTGEGSTRTSAELRRMQQNGTALLRDLSERLGHVYGLLSDAPARRFPLSEADFTPNATGKGGNGPVAESDRDYYSGFSRVSTQMVEPWNRLSKAYGGEAVAYGEGFFYNQRLHRISGYRWGATLKLLWFRIRNMWPL